MNRIGLVVGKFSPFHKGHKFLIDTALCQCLYVYVLPYSNPDLGISQVERILAIQNCYQDDPRVLVVHPNGKLPHNDDHPKIHRIFCAVEIFRYVATYNLAASSNLKLPDTVYSSEEYGEPFAADLSRVFGKKVESVLVDLHRKTVPISGTMIRNGGYDEWKV